eukprot:gene21416-27742_t
MPNYSSSKASSANVKFFRKRTPFEYVSSSSAPETKIVQLDICSITPRLLVMGTPFSHGLDSLRPLQAYLYNLHGHYKIFNLAAEHQFNIDHDLDNVENFPFNANNPCALALIIKFCTIVETYLQQNIKNVVIIHCRTGKGRSCLLTACYLLHCGLFSSAEEAVSFLCRERSPLLLNALCVPSQVRYVHYYEALLRDDSSTGQEKRVQHLLRILHIRMTTVPQFSASILHGGCSPYLSISVLARRTSPSLSSSSNDGAAQAEQWFPKRVYSQLDHTPMRRPNLVPRYRSDEQGGYLSFGREGVDLACRDEQGYSFHKDFKIEIFLQRGADPDQVRATALNTVTDSDLIGQGDADLSAADFLHSFGDTNIDESDEDGDGDGDDSRR